jgi:hypothetical protein
MPESDNSHCRAGDLNIEVGFHWSRDRYGPPPGITKSSLAKIEAQSDAEFFRWFLRWSPEEQESLMIGERYRRRTFNAPGWPSQCPADVNELAAEGFFWTGRDDRVRCAFCGGFLGNWERGDPPVNQQHRRFFPYCKRAQRKPSPNIPIPPPELRGDDTTPLDIHTPIGGTRDNNAVIKADAVVMVSDRTAALAITNQPYHRRYRVHADRLKSFRCWRPPPTFDNLADTTITPETLSAAGFFFEGPADNVRCFWCDGGLQDWDPYDDPWKEHASWYPGCRYLFLVKGPDFIINAQLTLSKQDRQTATLIKYNNAGTDFLLQRKADPTYVIRQQDWYVVLNNLGFDNHELDTLAQAHNFHLESFDIAAIVDALLARRANDLSDQQLVSTQLNTNADDNIQQLNSNAKAAINKHLPSLVDLTLYINDPPDDGFTPLQRDYILAAASKCINCNIRPKNTVTLPCGHLIYCHICVALQTPNACHVCHQTLVGTCRVFAA